ncbi:hypothetical protein Bca52824_000388 [Brassica carinata]|uniref:Uncharacterized protein n=1 Tax=Brassica carinata TaxID=52824 RepID=A0A8X7WE66_BRACI|nr:hypothetical protein Bca52824_000388 [Brassica carinata]
MDLKSFSAQQLLFLSLLQQHLAAAFCSLFFSGPSDIFERMLIMASQQALLGSNKVMCTVMLRKNKSKILPVTMKSKKEKERLYEIPRLKQKKEEIMFALQETERRYALAKSAIAQLEGHSDENMILAENVGTKNIAEVLSRWTVIPVTSLFQTEKERKRAGGQDQVVNAVSDALLWSRAGLGYSRNVFGSNHAVNKHTVQWLNVWHRWKNRSEIREAAPCLILCPFLLNGLPWLMDNIAGYDGALIMLQQGTKVISELPKHHFLQLQKRDSDIGTSNHEDQAYVFQCPRCGSISSRAKDIYRRTSTMHM